MENTRPPLHPALMIAAVSVTALSFAGIGVLTGLIPFGKNSTEPASQLQAAMQPQLAAAAPMATAPLPASNVTVNVSTQQAPAKATPAVVAKTAALKPVHVARTQESPIDVYRTPSTMRTSAPVVSQPAAPAICHDCGTIESVNEVAHEPDGSGIGAVAGGVIGGVLGNQVGQGRGRDLATVVGLIGGAVAGNKIEKTQKRVVEYQVSVRFEDGTSRVFTQATPPAWRSGDRVKVENGLLVSRA